MEVENSKTFHVHKYGELFRGNIYKEADHIDELKARPLASFDEIEAFWHTKESLEQLFFYCNLRVLETVRYTNDRDFFVLKPM